MEARLGDRKISLPLSFLLSGETPSSSEPSGDEGAEFDELEPRVTFSEGRDRVAHRGLELYVRSRSFSGDEAEQERARAVSPSRVIERLSTAPMESSREKAELRSTVSCASIWPDFRRLLNSSRS